MKRFHEREENADWHMVHAVFVIRDVFLIAGVADFRRKVCLGHAHFFPMLENLFGYPLIVFLVMRGLFRHLQSSFQNKRVQSVSNADMISRFRSLERLSVPLSADASA